MINTIKRALKKIQAEFIYKTKGGVARGRYLGVKIGNNCRIPKLDFSTEPYLIEIGNKVTIAEGTKLIPHDGSTWLVEDEKGRRYKYGKITIGNNVFIGANTIVLLGVTIGDNVVVGAGSVVTRSIASNSVAVGSPARVISTFDAYKEKVLHYTSAEDIGNPPSHELIKKRIL